jgi:hypothetical protein
MHNEPRNKEIRVSDTNLNDKAGIKQLWRWLGLLVWLAVSAAILVHYQNRLYSTSIDVGLHGTLVSRLMDSSKLPEIDENLAEMATYPRIAHSLAAWAGVEADSALDGMQWVANLSVILLWSAIGFALLRLPRQMRQLAFAGLALALLANRQWAGLEMFGSELVRTYFFAHFVAQAIAICLLTLALQREWARPESISHLLILGLGAPILVSVHLLPAVELLGTLGALVVLSGLVDRSTNRRRNLLAGCAIVGLSLVLTVLNPDFLALARLSTNNGLMQLNFVHSVRGMVVLSMLVVLLSLGMIALWWRQQARGATYDELLLKYFGAFGLSIAGLCMLQILLLAGFAKGSEYACFKYATGLQSMLVIGVVLLFAQLGSNRKPSADSGPILFAPSALAALACVCVLPKDSFVLTNKIVDAIREARSFAKSNERPPAGTHDFAIGIPEIGSIGDYLVSRMALGSPSLGESYDILLGKIPGDAQHIRWILTGENVKPWDQAECRRGTAGRLIAVDGACVYATISKLDCSGIIEFSSRGALDTASTGFSKPEADGRWSEGNAATLTCQRTDTTPRMAYLETAGLVSKTHNQTMIVAVNDELPQTFEYSEASPSRTVAIPLPGGNPSTLTFKFSFPDAISPRELGINVDERKLAVMMYRLKFEPE